MPLRLVNEKICSKINRYVKAQLARIMKESSSILIGKRANLDKFDTPFEVQEHY